MIEPPYIPIGFSLGWLEGHEQLTLSAVRGRSAVRGHVFHLTVGGLRENPDGGPTRPSTFRRGVRGVGCALDPSDEVLGGLDLVQVLPTMCSEGWLCFSPLRRSSRGARSGPGPSDDVLGGLVAL